MTNFTQTLAHPASIEDDPPEPCRTLFPLLQSCVYLDTGSAGVSFVGQGEAAASFYDVAKSQGYLGRELWQAKAAEVRQQLSSWMGVETQEIEFFSGTTDALNMVGHSIEWRHGDEIVMADDEFPSVQLAWQAAEKAGATIRKLAISSESERENILAAAVSPRTRMLVVSHVHSMTGTKLDLDRLGQLCRHHGALFVVDGIHAFGAVPPQLAHVDAYMAGVFKWMLAGFGLSVCVFRQRLRSQLQPAFRGYLNQPPTRDMQFAHVNYPGLYAFDASLKLLGGTIGWAHVFARTTALVDWLAEDLQRGGVRLAAPANARAGIASFRVPDSELAKKRLNENGMYAAARGKYLRASPFFYNSREDIRRFADFILRECL